MKLKIKAIKAVDEIIGQPRRIGETLVELTIDTRNDLILQKRDEDFLKAIVEKLAHDYTARGGDVYSVSLTNEE